jgi:hypothetical protein
MTASNANRRIPAGYFVAVVLLAMAAYLGAFYGCVHRPTCVARQYYAIDWLGERYFLADAIFAPGDWVDGSIRVAFSEWRNVFLLPGRSDSESPCAPIMMCTRRLPTRRS